MKQSELPIEVQNQLAKDRMALSGKVVNGAYTVELYNAKEQDIFMQDGHKSRGGIIRETICLLAVVRIGAFLMEQFSSVAIKALWEPENMNCVTGSDTIKVQMGRRFRLVLPRRKRS